MSRKTAVASGLLALTNFASAQVGSICPARNQVCFGLNIPASTASSGNGDVFFQMTAPSSYQWVALGQGRSMTGSNIFVMYTSSSGTNVTVSPRLGTGYSMPEYNSNAEIELLEGTGVSNGVMTANVKCSNCESWTGGSMDFQSNTGNWIYAYQQSGGAKNSDDTNAPINKHSQKAAFQWDMSGSKGGNSVNPFVTAAQQPAASSTASTGKTGTNSGFTELESEDKDKSMLMAHGILAALVFVIFFPMGAILIRLGSVTGVVMIHAAWQIFTYIVFVAAFGLGVALARSRKNIDEAHPIIGILVFVLITFMPILGTLHHRSFKQYQRRGVFSYAHIWVGRAVISLGIINGGLGLKLSDNAPKGAIIAYGIVGGLMWLVWVGASALGELKRKRTVSGKNMKGSGRMGPGSSGEQDVAENGNKRQ